jgi:hypothetical protein
MNVGSGTEMTLEELVLVPRRLHEAEITDRVRRDRQCM